MATASNLIVNFDRLQQLPRWAVVAFATRCALRVHPRWVPTFTSSFYGSPPNDKQIQSVEKLLEICKLASSHEAINLSTAEEATKISDKVSQRYYDDMVRRGHDDHRRSHDYDAFFDSHHDRGFEFRKSAEATVAAVKAALAAAAEEDAEVARWAAETAIGTYEYWYSTEDKSAIRRVIDDDYLSLFRSAEQEQWTDVSPVSQRSFALHSKFDLSTRIGVRTIIQIAQGIDSQLIEAISRHPESMYDLSPRAFESFIADILRQFGFCIELTAQTRDKGRDIVVVRNDVTPEKYLIEGKRDRRDKKIDLGIVQRLHGVVVSEPATKGILVTTAHGFTKPASEYLDRHKWILDVRDFDGVLDWLEKYQEMKMLEVLQCAHG